MGGEGHVCRSQGSRRGRGGQGKKPNWRFTKVRHYQRFLRGGGGGPWDAKGSRRDRGRGREGDGVNTNLKQFASPYRYQFIGIWRHHQRLR